MSALALSASAVALPALAQTSTPAPTPAPPPPPAGGYYTATGTRTADYNAALASWRNDAQFKVDYSKGFLGMEYAYVLGLSGKGQTVGINDAGVLASHPLFGGTGKFTGLRTAVPAGYGNDGLINPRRQWEEHGTHVAGTAAGGRVAGQLMFGNAFGANIYSATTNFAAGDFLWWRDQVMDGKTVATAQQNIVDLANTGKVRIVNNSWGSNTSLPYTATLAQAQAAFRQSLNGFYDPILRNDTLVVFSAGNGAGVHASVDAVTPLNDLRLRGNWLSVVNYRGNGTADPSSSLCGQTATWCVAGPGSAITSSIVDWTMNTAAVQAKYTRAMYPTIYAAGTVAALNTAAQNAFITVLNGYLNRKAAAANAGVAFNEDAEQTFVAQQAVAITLVYGSRFVGGDPDGFTSTLANILSNPANLPIFGGRDFPFNVLTRANDILQAELKTFITYNGPGYGALTGTSMAAPNITGMAAVLMEWFPDYNTSLISDILVSSSKDLDTPGVDLRSGWGAPQMGVALLGPTALRDTRTVTVDSGTVDLWANNIQDARDRYSPEVLAGFANDIGGLVKRGGGELILGGVNSYSGATRVDQGTLTVNGSLTRSALTAASGGTVGGTGTVASLTVASGGTLSPGNVGAIGTLSVTGRATLAAGSQYIADIGPSGSSDLLVAGSAVLQGGNLTLRPVNRVPRFGDAYTVLTASGGVTGTFGSTTAFSAILFPEAVYSANRVDVRVAARPYTSVVAATPVQTSYARLLDANRPAYSALSRTYDLLDLASVDTIRTSLEAIAPRSETMRRAIGVTATDNVARFYRDRIGALSPDTFNGGTLTMTGRPLEFAANAIVMPGQAAMVSDTSNAVVRENALPSNFSAFLSGGYLTGSGAAMPGAVPAGSRDEFDGFYIASGIEAQVDDTAILGFGLSYTDIDGDRSFGQSANGDLIQGTLYGRVGERFGGSFDAQVSAGVFQSRTRRTGTFAGTAFDLSGRDNALALSSEVGASYGFGSDRLRVAPRVAVRTNRIDFTPTAETGTGPALFYDADRFLSIQGRAGLQLDANEGGLRPIASAYFVHDFQDRADRFQAGFVGGTGARAPFLVASQDRNWGEMSYGFAYRTRGGIEFSAAADATFARKDVRNAGFRAGLKAPF